MRRLAGLSSEWLRREELSLRIVEPELFQRVQARLAQMTKSEAACLSGRRSKYLLSGILECAACGSKMILLSAGRAGQRRTANANKYGCPLAERGVCANAVRVAHEPLERKLIDALLERLSTPETLRRIEARVSRAMARERARLDATCDDRAALKERIDRLADLIAAGNRSPAPLARLREMEARLASRKMPAAAASVGVEVAGLRRALESKGEALKSVLAGMVRMAVGGGGGIRKAACTVWVGAGGQS